MDNVTFYFSKIPDVLRTAFVSSTGSRLIVVGADEASEIEMFCNKNLVSYIKNPSYFLYGNIGSIETLVDCANDFEMVVSEALAMDKCSHMYDHLCIKTGNGDVLYDDRNIAKYQNYFGLAERKSYKGSSVYFDIDGTLAKWYKDGRGLSYPEQILDPKNHYYRDLEPHKFMIGLAEKLVKKGVDVCIISAADLACMNDKIEWIKKYCPFIKDENIFFCPIGADKSTFIKSNIKDSVLIDDYNPNLDAWNNAGGYPIKVLNTVNNPNPQYDIIDCELAEMTDDKEVEKTCMKSALFAIQSKISLKQKDMELSH